MDDIKMKVWIDKDGDVVWHDPEAGIDVIDVWTNWFIDGFRRSQQRGAWMILK